MSAMIHEQLRGQTNLLILSRWMLLSEFWWVTHYLRECQYTFCYIKTLFFPSFILTFSQYFLATINFPINFYPNYFLIIMVTWRYATSQKISKAHFLALKVADLWNLAIFYLNFDSIVVRVLDKLSCEITKFSSEFKNVFVEIVCKLIQYFLIGNHNSCIHYIKLFIPILLYLYCI